MSETDDTQPTPGKWYEHEDGDGALCVSADRDQGGGDQFVAYIKAADNDQYPEAEANARLIAAAPDLLDAAQEAYPAVVSAIEALGDAEGGDLHEAERKLRDALDAARADE